jgi:hypothetical protein
MGVTKWERADKAYWSHMSISGTRKWVWKPFRIAHQIGQLLARLLLILKSHHGSFFLKCIKCEEEQPCVETDHCRQTFALMSLPYHRGHLNSAEMNQRGNGNWGTREQRVEEGNRTLMEEENDRQLVSSWCCSVESCFQLSTHLFLPQVLQRTNGATKRKKVTSKLVLLLNYEILGGTE